MSFHVPNQHRVRSGRLGSRDSIGNAGAFIIPALPPSSQPLRVIAAAGLGWEHVSVSLPQRCPNWPEMAYVKNLFWDPEDAVMQLHPPRAQYVNAHPYCLHLWRPIGREIPLPDPALVGPL